MARLRPYNPNVQIAAGAARPAERWKETSTDIEQLLEASDYLECCEARLDAQWNVFADQLQRDGMHKTRLGEVRLLWLEKKEEHRITELNELFRQGVPGRMRSHVWKDITLASRVED